MSCQKRAGDPMVKGQDGMGAEVFVMPGTQLRQSQLLPKPATNRQQSQL